MTIQLPDELLEGKHWCVWQLNRTGGKQPYNAPDGSHMSADNFSPVDYYTAETVAKSRFVTAGVGFIFTGTDYIGIDVDGKTDIGMSEKAQEAVDELLQASSGYWEQSVSGRGYHFIIPAKVAEALVVKPQYATYGIEFRGGKNNFSWLALTGKGKWNTPTTGDADMHDVAQKLYLELTAGIKCNNGNDWMSEKLSSGSYSKRKPHDLEQTMAMMQQYHPAMVDWLENGYPDGTDPSQRDSSLMYQLYYWSQQKEVVREIMFNSALYRDKFNRASYFEATLNKVIKLVAKNER